MTLQTHHFEAIIFDHDGTLVDTESPDFRACQLLYEEFGLSLSLEYWAEMVVGHHEGYEYLFDELSQSGQPNGLSRQDLQRRLNRLWDLTFQEVQLMPGVTDLLPHLQTAGYRLAVATASDRAWADRWLTHFELGSYFPVIATGEDVAHNKPAPDVYLLAAARLEVPPERCLVFEDSLPGVQAAKAAGMIVVAVPSQVTGSLDFSQADHIVSGLDQLSLAQINRWAR